MEKNCLFKMKEFLRRPDQLGNIAAVLVFIFILFIRLTKIPELFYFGIDEEYQSFLGWSLVKNFHLIWIGLSVADTGFYLGPGLVYLHALLLFISKGDPVILAYSAAVIGIITSTVIYLVSTNLFNRQVGFIALIFYGLSAFMNYFDRRFWNPTTITLISLLVFYSFCKVQKNPYWWVAVTFLLGLIFHTHASLFVYIFIAILIGIRYLKTKKILPIKVIIFSFLTGVSLYSPLIAFDIAKNFENLKAPIRLLTRVGDSGGVQIFDHLAIVLSTLSRSLVDDYSLQIMVIFTVLFLYGYYFVRFRKQAKKNEAITVLFLCLGIFMLSLIIFPGKIYDYYVLGIVPLFYIFVAYLLSKLPKKFITLSIVGFLFLNISLIWNLDTDHGLIKKKHFIQKVSTHLNGRQFYLDTADQYVFNGGWRYLFKMYGQTPVSSRADEMFGWIYPEELSNISPRYYVVIGKKEIDSPKPPTIIRSKPYSAQIYEISSQ